MPKAPVPKRIPPATAGPAAKRSIPALADLTHRVPLQMHDYRLDPRPFPALKTEQGVFTTPPYSGDIKSAWRYKDEAAARESSEEIWGMFERYRDDADFIGADTARKFIQMGRTRSLRYALRRGGKKYEETGVGEKREMKRTGEVYDQGKLGGANIYEKVLARCWEDAWYKSAFEDWRTGKRPQADRESSIMYGGVKAEWGAGPRRKRNNTGRGHLD